MQNDDISSIMHKRSTLPIEDTSQQPPRATCIERPAQTKHPPQLASTSV